MDLVEYTNLGEKVKGHWGLAYVVQGVFEKIVSQEVQLQQIDLGNALRL